MKQEIQVKTETVSPQKGRKKKEENTQEVWKWYVQIVDFVNKYTKCQMVNGL